MVIWNLIILFWITSKELGLNIYNGNIYSSDVFYEQNNDFKDKVAKYNVLGVEMESFALFTNAKSY